MPKREKPRKYPKWVVRVDDDGKLWRRFVEKRRARYTVGFELSFEQFCSLLVAAKIKSSDIGLNRFHLARIGDEGPYVLGCCRFLWCTKNTAEIRSERRYRPFGNKIWLGRTHTLKTRKQMSNSHLGKHGGTLNSQFGRCWITKKGVDKKIAASELTSYLKRGFKRGRAKPFGSSSQRPGSEP
jgi:hypothetical protein